jgi:hypothetical protein
MCVDSVFQLIERVGLANWYKESPIILLTDSIASGVLSLPLRITRLIQQYLGNILLLGESETLISKVLLIHFFTVT